MSDVWLRGGPPVHPFVYSKRILRTERGARDGDVVRLRTREGRPVGFGFWHGGSLIAVRVLTYDPDLVPDEAWLSVRIREAEAIRRDTLRLPSLTNAWRVVHAEGDGLSGLVVDRYGDVASVQVFSLGWARRQDEVARVLVRETGVHEVVVRADAKAAQHEGMALAPPAPRPRVRVEERGVRYWVDPTGGHKTGFFLDQRDNRAFVAALAKGRDVFDGMTYTGGFAVACAAGGARAVRGMDLDEEAVARAVENARENRVDVRFDHGDVFDALRAYVRVPPSDRPEVVVVDPPKWARDRAGLGAALQRYRDLNRLALDAVRPGGVVCTCSCSGLVSEETFLDVVRAAALDLGRETRVLHVGGAAPDHPVALSFPEGRYLKCVVLAVGAPRSGPGGSAQAGRGPTGP